jgi:predicted acyl esterase
MQLEHSSRHASPATALTRVAPSHSRTPQAVVAACASDDRFADDMHYKGGALLSENASWGAWLLHTAAQPPDPLADGQTAAGGADERTWHARWLERLEALTPPHSRWLRHSAAEDRCGQTDRPRSTVCRHVGGLGGRAGWTDRPRS